MKKVPLSFAYAFRSFVGYLEGTEKAAHTIKNYRSDLASFQEYLTNGLGSRTVALAEVTRDDLENYHEYLKSLGLKTNTRRRKILTVRKLLKYLTLRNKIGIDVGQKLPAPHKVERIPKTVPSDELVRAIRALDRGNEHLERNRVLLWTLAETGCQVSEVCRVRFSDYALTDGGARLALGGKSARTVEISRDLFAEVRELQTRAKVDASAVHRDFAFFGFNKFGPLTQPISSRGVELLVKVYAARLGLAELTPRTFRHSVVMKWFAAGVSRDEIQKRLGLRSAYAFRVYEPMFKAQARSNSKTTSTSDTRSPQS